MVERTRLHGQRSCLVYFDRLMQAFDSDPRLPQQELQYYRRDALMKYCFGRTF